MTRKLLMLTLIFIALVALLGTTALAAKAPAVKQGTDSRVAKVGQYSFADAHNDYLTQSSKAVGSQGQALGAFRPTQSPGVDIGDSWYEYQRNGSMRRMITTGIHTVGKADTFLVHFSWMYLPSRDISQAREYRYDVFNATSGIFGTETGLQPDDNYAGYCGVSRTLSNRAVVGGHNNLTPPAGPYQVQIYWDFGPGNSFFNTNSRVPDSTGEYCDTDPASVNGGIWPAFEYQEGPEMTVTHVIACESTTPEPVYQALYYFRKIGAGAAGVWDHPPFCLDTVAVLAHDLDVITDDSLVGLAWAANRSCDPACDTCSADPVSGNDCIEQDFGAGPQQDNDLYYKFNTHYGDPGAWMPRVNVTHNQDTIDGYRPYTDLSCLFASDGLFHIDYIGMLWRSSVDNPDDTGRATRRSRIFHVAADPATNLHGPITTIVNAEFFPPQCNGGGWNLNASKMTISECNGKLYTLFVKFNDPDEPGMADDCAYEENPGPYPIGAANGDIFISVSDDGGSTWDKARNITNSHTPGCDSTLGAGGPCDNDHWPSMVRFGTNFPGTFPVDATIPNSVLNDDPPSHAGYYLDAQYINDKSAGGIVQDEGWWQSSDVMWVRIPCVEPKREAVVYVSPNRIGCPCWTKHGTPKSVPGEIEGGGNVAANWAITPVTIVPPSPWLAVSPTGGTVNPNQRVPITITINNGGTVNNPGTIVYLDGFLVVNWGGAGGNPPPAGDYDTIFVECWVADTLIEPVWDTLFTACTRLEVSNHGNAGHQGEGRVNLDYVGTGQDCDDSAYVYLYDGSPYICYLSEADETPGLDTNCYYSLFVLWCDTNSLRPIDTFAVMSDSAGAQKYQTGVIVPGADSTVCIEKIWYAPKNDPETCSFVVQVIKFYGNPDDTTFTAPISVRMGEAIDWDVPADTGSRNNSGFDPTLRLYYQQGHEEDGAGCQSNDRRWAGMAFLDCYKNGVRCDDYPQIAQHGTYAHTNSTHVYPNGKIPDDTLYKYSGPSGYAAADSQATDLHTVMTFDTVATMTQADTFVFYVLLASHRNGTLNDFKDEVRAGIKWYCGHISPEDCGCCNGDGLRGNADGITGAGGEVDVADLTYLVAYLFLGGPAPPCLDEGNVDGITGAGGPVDVADLTYLVAYLFLGGPAPAPC